MVKKTIKKLFSCRYFLYKGWNTTEKTVAITFDDGPHSKYTPKVLEILGEENVKATFFLTGKNVERYPGIAKKIVDEGHEIGNHFYSHERVNKRSLEMITEEIEKSARIIFEATGQRTRLIRPPYGKFNLNLLWYTYIHNLTLTLWSYDIDEFINSLDGGDEESEANWPSPGEIILFHDDELKDIEILQPTIHKIKDKDFKFVTVSEIIGL